jgi:hypothetical protein
MEKLEGRDLFTSSCCALSVTLEFALYGTVAAVKDRRRTMPSNDWLRFLQVVCIVPPKFPATG